MGAVEAWLESHDDADIEDDLIYIDLCIDNLQARAVPAKSPRAGTRAVAE
jgi:hypothetical protein